MRLINMYASDRSLTCDTHWAGVGGENRATQLVIRLDPTVMGDYDYYLRFCTSEQATRGGMTVTQKLDTAGGVLLFSLPSALMKPGILRVQLMVTNGEYTLFSPTLKGGLEVSKAIDGVDESLDPDTENDIDGQAEKEDYISFYDISEYAAKRATVGDFLVKFARAENVSLEDAGGFYASDNVEAALQELATGINSVAASLNGLV